MAEAQANQAPSLSESYLLEKNEKQNTSIEPVEVKEVAASVTTLAEEPVTNQSKETPAAAESTPASAVEESAPVTATEETTEAPTATEESTEAPPAAEETNEEVPAGTGDNDENSNAREEAGEETPEIKIETVPADFRFPTTNQTRHCFTRYVEYHRCVAAKGDGAQECDKFAKYYRSLCPSEWVEKWNEQRENGTFPGPL